MLGTINQANHVINAVNHIIARARGRGDTLAESLLRLIGYSTTLGQIGYMHMIMYSSSDMAFRISGIMTFSTTSKLTSGTLDTLVATAADGASRVDGVLHFDTSMMTTLAIISNNNVVTAARRIHSSKLSSDAVYYFTYPLFNGSDHWATLPGTAIILSSLGTHDNRKFKREARHS
jgi:hypothetical protein